MATIEKDIYVVVADNDQKHKYGLDGHFYSDIGGQIVFEQYVKNADLESVKKRARQLSKNYGKCRIAKLTFLEEE